MFKTLIAATIVASTLAAFATAHARPTAQPAPTQDTFYMDRASQNHDNGGN